ncbi:Ig-like domain-containing protein [Vibrio lentus]|nr:Ig-like domain-containing protein [Vibrio lentus]
MQTDNEGAASVASAVSAFLLIQCNQVMKHRQFQLRFQQPRSMLVVWVTLTATAADSDGTVDKVDFYVAGALAGTAATSLHTILDYALTTRRLFSGLRESN